MSIGPDHSHHQGGETIRLRGLSGRTLNRRVVMKAAAGVAAIAAAGGIGVTGRAPAVAQSDSVTRADSWSPSEFTTASVGSSDEWATFTADYPFYALGVSWNGDVGLWPVIEVQLSADGETWSETFQMVADNDSGRETRDNRIFTSLLHSSGAQYVRYRTVDIDGVPGQVAGLEFVYIDATDGPWEQDLPAVGGEGTFTAASDDNRTPPQIVTREEWGANEGYRFDTFGEIWPPTYDTVHHVIVHHTATPNSQDAGVAVRSIYYYHAVTQGWGDIGYNYLVGRDGRIFQGRYGGQNVVGGHSFQYAEGSSGISIIGDYRDAPVPDAALTGLVAITAWVARDLDPNGSSDFLQAPDLPTIASHRDVNATSCPGDFLYNELPEIRDLVAAAQDELATPFAGGIIPGDRVRVQTDDGSGLNVREQAGPQYAVTGSLDEGSYAMVLDGPVEGDESGNWYLVESEETGVSGWVAAFYLIVAPIPPPPFSDEDLPFGLNIFAQSAINVRESPNLNARVLDSVQRGHLGFIMDGPRDADGDDYDWYQVRWEGGAEGWSVKQFLQVAPFDEEVNGRFSVGDNVEATEQINVRVRPGLPQTIIARISAGARLQITQEPVAVNDYIWYGVYSDSAGGGWVVERTLRAVGDAPEGKFDIGDSARVTEAMRLRSSASTSASIIANMPAGTTGEITGGPQTGSGYTWWQFRTSAFGTGWAAQDWLEETQAPGPAPDGKFDTGDGVRVTENLNMRSGASTSNGVIVVLPAGTTGTVVSGPRTGSGYTWWQIETSLGTGWVVEDWLAASENDPGTPPPSGGRFDVGEGVRVTEALNMRSGASTSNGVITVLPAGTTGTVVSGPQTGSGYTWWEIETGRGTGWVAQDWLTSSGSGEPTPGQTGKFDTGDGVRVTEALNLRSGASTSNGVITVLPAGTSGTVVSGPRTGSGYTWWEIETSRGTGWVVEDWLTASDGSGTPSATFDIGESVRVTEPLNLRNGAGTGNSVVTVLSVGTTGTVTDGPSSASGYTWWEIDTSQGTGWVAENWLA